MALPPGSSLRPLVLLMSHGKPQLKAFFSSSTVNTFTAALQAAPGGDTPAAPVARPPFGPRSDIPKHPVHESPRSDIPQRPVHEGPSKIFDDGPATCILEDPKQPILADSCCMLPPSGRPPFGPRSDIPQHPVHEGPSKIFDDEPATCILEDPEQPIPTDSCCTLPPPARPPFGPRSDIPQHHVHEGPRSDIPQHPVHEGPSKIFDDGPATCILEDPEQPTPADSCCTLPPVLCMPVQDPPKDNNHIFEDPRHPIHEDPKQSHRRS